MYISISYCHCLIATLNTCMISKHLDHENTNIHISRYSIKNVQIRYTFSHRLVSLVYGHTPPLSICQIFLFDFAYFIYFYIWLIFATLQFLFIYGYWINVKRLKKVFLEFVIRPPSLQSNERFMSQITKLSLIFLDYLSLRNQCTSNSIPQITKQMDYINSSLRIFLCLHSFQMFINLRLKDFNMVLSK
jgi:hypothetical protein